ncbi:hypothetical protein TB2_015166 [Malus domestica]
MEGLAGLTIRFCQCRRRCCLRRASLSENGGGETIALGFQHYILALGTAVMIPTFRVPLMGGDDGDKVGIVQTLLFIQGISTLLQTLF